MICMNLIHFFPITFLFFCSEQQNKPGNCNFETKQQFAAAYSNSLNANCSFLTYFRKRGTVCQGNKNILHSRTLMIPNISF